MNMIVDGVVSIVQSERLRWEGQRYTQNFRKDNILKKNPLENEG
jgi:hypothetical protein